MQLIRGLHNIQDNHRGCVVTIGNLDGVHLGHQSILIQLIAKAKQLAVASCAVTFEPQPVEFFQGKSKVPRLSNLREKFFLLKENRVDLLLCLAFNRHLSSYSAEAFVEKVLVKGLSCKHLLVGDDFRFGCDRSGDLTQLSKAGRQYGFTVTKVPTFTISGQRVSSTYIRQALAVGDCQLATKLLGHPYFIIARVIHGRGWGLKLGVPTANLNVFCRDREIAVRGVFLVWVCLPDESAIGNSRKKLAVANVGVRPSLSPSVIALEVHIIDFSDNLYGKLLQVEFLEKLRDEKKFHSSEALKSAIHQDIEQARLKASRYNF